MTSGKFRTVSTVSSSLKLLTRAMAPPRPGGTPDNGGHNAVSVRTLPLLEEVGPLSSLLYIDKQTMFDNSALGIRLYCKISYFFTATKSCV